MLVRRKVSADASGLLVFNVLGTICFAELDLAPLLGKVTVNSLCFGADLSFLTVSACREEANSRWTPIVAVLDTSVRLDHPLAVCASRAFSFALPALLRERPIATPTVQHCATTCNDLQCSATNCNMV